MVLTRASVILKEAEKMRESNESNDVKSYDDIALITIMEIYCQTQRELVDCQKKLQFWTNLFEARSRALCRNASDD